MRLCFLRWHRGHRPCSAQIALHPLPRSDQVGLAGLCLGSESSARHLPRDARARSPAKSASTSLQSRTRSCRGNTSLSKQRRTLRRPSFMPWSVCSPLVMRSIITSTCGTRRVACTRHQVSIEYAISLERFPTSNIAAAPHAVVPQCSRIRLLGAMQLRTKISYRLPHPLLTLFPSSMTQPELQPISMCRRAA